MTTRVDQLKSLFIAWHGILSSATTCLARCPYPDLPYWYGERTQIGWLALGAQGIGGLPLQEPSVSRRKKGVGRSDLWVYTDRAGKIEVYDFEAKVADLPLHTLNRYKSFLEVDDIKGKLQRVVRQVKDKRHGYEGDLGVGLVFVRLQVKKSASKAEMLKLALKFKKHTTSRTVLPYLRADFIAVYFAPYRYVKRVLAHSSNKAEDPYLGIAVVGRIAS